MATASWGECLKWYTQEFMDRSVSEWENISSDVQHLEASVDF